MHILKIVLIFNFDVFYVFRARELILRKTAVNAVIVWYVLDASVREI
jgi:hypothetical protein